MNPKLIRSVMGQTELKKEPLGPTEKDAINEEETRKYYIESNPILQKVITDLNTRMADNARRIFNLSLDPTAFSSDAYALAHEAKTIQKVIKLIQTDKYEN